MGAGVHGGFGGGGKSKPDVQRRPRTIDDNVKEMNHIYPHTSNGYFGEKGKNVRVIKTSTPEITSSDFYHRISKGGRTEPLKNGHGTRTLFQDGTVVVHRMITSTKGSPAVDIKVIKPRSIKSQKIHFIKED